jgi:hypothetical protein
MIRFSFVIGRREVRVRENQNRKTEEGFRLNCCKPRAVSAPTPCGAGEAICTTLEGACDRRRSDFDNGVQLRFHPSHRRAAELLRNAQQFDTGAVFGLPYPVSDARSVLTLNAQRSARPRPWLIDDVEHPELCGGISCLKLLGLTRPDAKPSNPEKLRLCRAVRLATDNPATA